MRRFAAALIGLAMLLGLFPGLAQARTAHKFGFICNGFDNEWFASILDSFRALGARDGIQVLGGEHHADANVLLDQAENMIAAGVDVLMFQNFDPEGIEELVVQWEAQGVNVISYDGLSEAASVNLISPSYDCGYMIGEMAADWIDKNLAEQERVEVYIHGHIYESLSLRADAIEDALTDLCPKAVVVDRQDVLGAMEPSAFEQSLVAHPDIQVVCTINDTSCISICEWWISELKGKGADLGKYAGFSIDAVDSGLALIAASRENKAIFRGTLDGRDMGRTILKIWNTAQKLWAGEDAEDWPFEYRKVTAANIYEYGY